MRAANFAAILLACACSMVGIARSAHAQTDVKADPLAPLGRFTGEWAGTASGQSGAGTVTRTYSPAMNGRFVRETNVSRYPAVDKSKSDELHEHMSMFSYDKARKLIVLRQFHVEGFVNTYHQVAAPEVEGALVFESEAFENFSNAWKARESYEFLSDDEFIETFELAPPGKPYQLYSRNQLKRVSTK
jgi:hypothetical protein